MATHIMESHVLERERLRRPNFSAIRWTAIFAGLVGGMATYMLLSLLGIAVGLTAIDPTAAEPVGAVPIATGIWTGISLLLGALVGGYVAGRMSGLSRTGDGLLHGFVSWASITVLFAFLTTTALGAMLGGTFRILGQGISLTAQGVSSAATQADVSEVGTAITGTERANLSAESLAALRERIAAGDRDGAISVLTSEMGFAEERATQIVDGLMAVTRQAPTATEVRQGAAEAAETVSAASWWLFTGLVLSLALGMIGGAMGSRSTSRRTVGDHTQERQGIT